MSSNADNAPLGLRVGRSCAHVSLAMVILLQLGCAAGLHNWARNGLKVGPDYLKPPAPVAEDWIDSDDPAVEHRQITDWWTVFDDSVLSEHMQTAYSQNLTLREAGTRVLQARAQQAIAVGNIFPQSQQAFGEYS